MAGQTRLAMMLPGAVSLGAYEGGALAAILTAVRATEGELIIDAIASASAGSITALIATRALLCAADPVDLMTATWVDLPSLERLKTHDHASPLSMQKLRDAATDLLGTGQVPDGDPAAYRQAEPVRLSMALTALGGLTYRLASLRTEHGGDPAATTVAAQTNIDWFETTLSPGAGATELLAAVDGALASASTPIGFPAALLDRSHDPVAMHAYAAAGLVNPTNDWHIWYSDGGDIDNEPFGRVLDLIDDTATGPQDDRVIVLLDTEPSLPSWGGKWFDPDANHVPTWTSTLRRVGHVQKSHNYYDDLRRLEKTNTRLAWTELVADTINQHLDATLPTLDPAAAAAVRAAIDGALTDAAAHIAADKAALRAAIVGADAATPASAPKPDDPAPTLLAVLEAAAGLHGKRKVVVEIVSPDIDPADHRPAAEKLAGEFLFHFGGFFDERFRQNDFALGYRNASTWLEGWLTDRVTDPVAVLAEVKRRYDALGWDDVNAGDASVHSLSLKEDAQALALVAHLAHVVEYGLRHDLFGD